MKLFKKTRILQSCRHSALDAESNVYNNLGITACVRMTFLMIFSKVSLCIYQKLTGVKSIGSQFSISFINNPKDLNIVNGDLKAKSI